MKTSLLPAYPFLLAALLLSSGCLFVPIPKATPLEGTEVKQADLAFLLPGQTTKAEVIGKIGKPTIWWRDENILVYRWIKLHGVLLWVIGGGYSAAAGAVDVTQEYAFLIKFDSNDRFQTSEIVKKPPLKSYGRFLLDWRDQRARGWQPPQEIL
jgi:hypothetical protein